ncbi:MAG: alpha/beta fold hydrolase [Lachnospiraceae bacterium]|nr:alpha/beta fold hydrolase [Lachnospiraceae bacterium]
MKKSTKRILFVTGATLTAIYAYNKFISATATKKQLLSTEEGNYFEWTHGNIFYTKYGTGSPILLIHDANPTASSEEWSKIARRLSKHHTVYAIDLLGCGRSDKPALEYTNYLYVQLITAFVKNIIGEKPIIISTNLSSSFVIMANHMDNTLFQKMIFINPSSLKQLQVLPDKLSKWKKTLVQLPFIGTFIYNLLTNPHKIDKAFRNQYYSKPQLISSKLEDIYYESAHTNDSNGRYLYSSLIGNYLNNNIVHALKALDTQTLIIGSNERTNYEHTLDNYHKLNPSVEIMRITHGNLYPHMEIPEKMTSIIENYIK